MPFITSQFLRRENGDRPQVLPQEWANLASPISSANSR
ncbi:MAG: oleate hydratase [Candidatus Acidiferrum sp.]